MTLHLLTPAQKLTQVEDLLRFLNEYRFASPDRMTALKAIAQDLKAQIDRAPADAVVEIERRLNGVKTAPSDNSRVARKVALADEMAGRWPVIRLALEFYAAHVARAEA